MFFPLLYIRYSNECTSGTDSVKLIKFGDDTTLISFIVNNVPEGSNMAEVIVWS